MIALQELRLPGLGPYRGRLAARSVLGVMGRDDGGATRLLEAISGARRHGGQVLVRGRRRRRGDVAFAPQEPEQILFGQTARDAVGAAGAQVLHRLGGAHLLERDFLTLSSGERRRLALAAVLGSGRPLLLFDLPTAGLDPEGQASFWAALAAHEGVAVVALAAADEAAHCTALLTAPGAGEPLPAGGVVPAPLQRRAGWPPDAVAELAWTLGIGTQSREELVREVRRWATRGRS